jgi:hypothetical protein
MKYKNIIKLRLPENTTINFVHADYCSQISHQRYISAVIHTALLNNVRKVDRLVLSRTSCIHTTNSVDKKNCLKLTYFDFLDFGGRSQTIYVVEI